APGASGDIPADTETGRGNAGNVATIVKTGAHIIPPQAQGLGVAEGQGYLRFNTAEAGVLLGVIQARQRVLKLVLIIVEVCQVAGAGLCGGKALIGQVVTEAAAV